MLLGSSEVKASWVLLLFFYLQGEVAPAGVAGGKAAALAQA